MGVGGAAHRGRRLPRRPRHRRPHDPQRGGPARLAPSTSTRAATAARRPSPGCTRSDVRPAAWCCCTSTARSTTCPPTAPTSRSDGTRVGSVGSSARHHELGPIALALVKRNTDPSTRPCSPTASPPPRSSSSTPRPACTSGRIELVMTEETSFADLGLDDVARRPPRAPSATRRPRPIQAQADPGAARGQRRRRPGADRHRQDRRVRAADPAAARPRRPQDPGARPGARPASWRCRSARPSRRYAAGIPGLRVLPVYGGQGYGAQLQGLQARRAHRRRHARPRHRPPRARQPRPHGASSSSCSTRPTRCSTWASPRTSSGSCADTPEYKQVALFSATMPPADPPPGQAYLHDPSDIATPEATTSHHDASASAGSRSRTTTSSTP